MRIIHTADWHLGQNFMGKSREPEHQAFLDWLLSLIKLKNIDALIVAGDIYDTGTPPSYARQLYNRFVVDILNTGCQMVVVGGNHDSVAMLEESSDLLNHVGIRQIARPSDNPSDQVVQLRQAKRPGFDTTHPGALVCAVPFLRPRDIVKSTAGQDSAAKQLQLQTAIANHYKEVHEAAVKLRNENNWDCPIIATGHLTAMGATRSDSVRDIYIGTLEAFAADAFPPADYIALGHIHSAQKVAKSDKIRYSGSPIPLSFDETRSGRSKSVVQLTVSASADINIQTIPIPTHRVLQTIQGSLEEIEAQVKQLSLQHGQAPGPSQEQAPSPSQEQTKQQTKQQTKEQTSDQTLWLEIIVESQGYLNDLPLRIDKMLDGCNAEVLLLRRRRQPIATALQGEQNHTLNELTVDDIFDYRLKEEFASEEEQTDPEKTDPEKTNQEQQAHNSELKERLKTLYKKVVSEVQSGDAP